jgi:hypothetical protein
VLLLQTLAGAYPNLDVVMLWGNMNATTKELFRDQLLVSYCGLIMIFYTDMVVVVDMDKVDYHIFRHRERHHQAALQGPAAGEFARHTYHHKSSTHAYTHMLNKDSQY